MPAAAAQISPGQLRALWAAARDNGYDEEALRDLVQARFGSRSISGLSGRQAHELLDALGKRPRAPRDGAPAAAMIRKIHALWGELGRLGYFQQANHHAALREFVKKRFGVSDVKFLGVPQARKVIEALKEMVAREQAKRGGGS